MTTSPLISVITVVYNGDEHLQQTIDSVANQTYSNIEYIIVDGGSTDKTLDIIKANNARISNWISEPDQGLYDAMNKGAALANGELVGTINSDDWYEANAVELIVKAYLENPDKKVFHADKRCIESNGQSHVKKAKTRPFLLKYHAMIYNHPTMFIHRDIYKNLSYNTQLSSLSDYELTLRVYLSQPEVFYYLPVVISNFRLGGISGKISFWTSINENYRARRNAGMSFIGAAFAYCIRVGFSVYKLIIR